MSGEPVSLAVVYRYTVRLNGRAGRTALTFRNLDGAERADAIRCPPGTRLRTAPGGGRLVIAVPKPHNRDRFVLLDAAEALEAAGKGEWGLDLAGSTDGAA